VAFWEYEKSLRYQEIKKTFLFDFIKDLLLLVKLEKLRSQ